MGLCSRSVEPGAPQATRAGAAYPPLPFRSVNRPGGAGYDSGLQRHHLLPRQLLGARAFAALWAELDPRWAGFDDFRRNGLLLPATPITAVRLGLPLHRGPHRAYTAMVMDRVGAVEREWARRRGRAAITARRDALFRLDLLQRALRRGLLRAQGPRRPLNRQDPAFQQARFADLDAMADALWGQLEMEG